MRELSIFAAAEECGETPCIIDGEQTVSFAGAAERTQAAIERFLAEGYGPGRPIAIVPEVDVESLVSLYAAFEIGAPVVLIHPRLTSTERRPILDQVEAVRGHPMAVVYTSGTSGAPRGTMLSRRAFIASHDAHVGNLPWRTDDRWLLAMPPAHIGGLSIITRCLIGRRCVVLLVGPFDAAGCIETMRASRVTLSSLVPTTLSRLLGSRDPRWECGSLRAVLVGGAPLSKPLRERAVCRGIPILTTYGLTEACSQVTTQRLDQSGTSGSGQPLQSVSLRIRDTEIQLSGPTLMDGYVEDPNPESTWTPDGWLRTGDVGRIADDGQLLVEGRLDDRIISGGENVDPLEVERVLESMPGIVSAFVFGRPHGQWGQEVVAAVATEGAPIDPAEVSRGLRSRLAGFKRPKRIAFFEALPVDRNGKVDRARLMRDAEASWKAI